VYYNSKIRIVIESEQNNVDEKDQDSSEDDADSQGSFGPVVQRCGALEHC
jgi:hypothetical protein